MTSTTISTETAIAVARLREIRESNKQGKAVEDALRKQILTALAGATEGLVSGLAVVSVAQYDRTGVDMDMLKNDYPQVYAKVAKSTTVTRVDVA